MGSHLVQFVIELARAASVKAVSIGVIGEHTELQRWYSQLGFKNGELKRFPHLPFSVQYMTYTIDNT